jgi:hypothetical protein
MPDAVPLRLQLACAKKELARRVRVYPGMIASDTLLTSTATRELAAMTAIVRTLGALVDAEAGAGGGQAELFDARGGSEREA